MEQTEQTRNAANDQNTQVPSVDDILVDDTFSYEGYQVVRSEFFAHMLEPSVSFSRCRMYVNTMLLRKLPNVDYIQVLVNKEEKKLVLRPVDEDAKDAFRWCNEKDSTKKPRQITCRVFFAKLFEMMDWNQNYRYKLLGKVIRSGEERLAVFDLTATEVYVQLSMEGNKPKMARKPVFPKEWENQFGLPVEEHKKQLTVNIFEGYTVFGIAEEKDGDGASENERKELNGDE